MLNVLCHSLDEYHKNPHKVIKHKVLSTAHAAAGTVQHISRATSYTGTYSYNISVDFVTGTYTAATLTPD